MATAIPGAKLTPREAECLDAYGELWSYRAVARRLGIANGTVRKHLENARAKYGVKMTGQALALRAQERAI